jgi:hypothetical protein
MLPPLFFGGRGTFLTGLFPVCPLIQYIIFRFALNLTNFPTHLPSQMCI